MEKSKVGIVYQEMIEAIKYLPLEQQAKIYNALFEYQFTGEILTDDAFVKSFVLSHKVHLDNIIKRRKSNIENGNKGGRPKTETNPTETQNNPKQTQQNPIKTKTNPTETLNKKQEVKSKKQEIKNKKDLKELAVIKANRTLSLPQQVYEYFASKYKQLSGKDYLPDKKDFVLLAELIKNFGIDEVKQRIDWLEIGCRNGIFWFAKEQNDFTIGKLRKFWNEILPKLTDEQRKQAEQKRKEEEMQKRIEANLEAEEQIRRQANVGNIGRV